MRSLLYRIGRYLVLLNYVKTDDENRTLYHDLRSQVQSQRREIDRLRMEIVSRDMKIGRLTGFI